MKTVRWSYFNQSIVCFFALGELYCIIFVSYTRLPSFQVSGENRLATFAQTLRGFHAMTEASDAAAFDHAASVVAKINGNDAAGLQEAGELFAKLSLLGSLAA